ncbi:hypothetical protein PACTADRAFT_50275 [Pachysolen tannophilus NRRL Y-2460]|uniref:Probable NADPH dehydrogenase n=1 Tax=Pachysolen tannophilus NRRL Y-2460 TaxID=669874 RepID=A0A1E4TUX7_PACTA|nr:hypothetical protein PACTADRAFT_50275 [Pachysolen tannophilus NRRL Y-2460]
MSIVKTKYSLEDTNLFKSIRLGTKELKNRAVFAPSTRSRSAPGDVPSDLMLKYYEDRSKDNGGLIITEGTFVSKEASGYSGAPGIYTLQQAKAWKLITDKIHKHGTFVSCQLWNLGRAADPFELKERGVPYVAPSVVYPNEDAEIAARKSGVELQALTLKQIEEFKKAYIEAAKYAINVSNFDYVEIHSAHGYFLDQFLEPSTNHRTDKYGGSIENRARLVLEIIDSLIKEIGADKIGIRVSPWAEFGGMKGENESIHPIVGIGYLLSELQQRANKGNELAYISIVEPRVNAGFTIPLENLKDYKQLKSNLWIYQIWRGNIIRAGAYLTDREDNYQLIRNDVNANNRTLIAFSRYYTSNPDLVKRLKYGLELTPYDRPTFYTHTNYHYGDWTFYGQENKSKPEDEESKKLPVALVSA